MPDKARFMRRYPANAISPQSARFIASPFLYSSTSRYDCFRGNNYLNHDYHNDETTHELGPALIVLMSVKLRAGGLASNYYAQPLPDTIARITFRFRQLRRVYRYRRAVGLCRWPVVSGAAPATCLNAER